KIRAQLCSANECRGVEGYPLQSVKHRQVAVPELNVLLPQRDHQTFVQSEIACAHQRPGLTQSGSHGIPARTPVFQCIDKDARIQVDHAQESRASAIWASSSALVRESLVGTGLDSIHSTSAVPLLIGSTGPIGTRRATGAPLFVITTSSPDCDSAINR